MSSVDSEVICPKCGFEEANESWNSRGYTQTFCNRCGYWHEEDWRKGAVESAGGYGSFMMTFVNGNSKGGGLAKPQTIAELKRGFRKAMRSLWTKSITVTLPNSGGWTTTVLKNFPRSEPKVFRKKGKLQEGLPQGSRRSGVTVVGDNESDDIPF